LKVLESNVFHIVLWKQVQFLSLLFGCRLTSFKNAPVPPERFRLVADKGKLIIINSPALIQFAQNGLLGVLDSTFPLRWFNHDVRVPIPVTSDSPVLLKSPDVRDCFELDTEVSQLPHSSVIPPSYLSDQVVCGSANVASDAEVAEWDQEITILSASESSSAAVASERFPLLYTCDMETGMAAIAGADCKGEAAFKMQFQSAFPGLPFKLKTFYKHLRFYSEALKMGLVATSAGLGRTPDGRWKELVKRVEQKRTKASSEFPILLIHSGIDGL
jgi:hypothetical protein